MKKTMEHIWNIVYLLFGAIIASAVGIIGEKIKNFGKVYFAIKSIYLEEIFKQEDDGTGGRKDTEILESIKVHCDIAIINSSNEQKICQDIKIKIKPTSKKIEEEYECHQSENMFVGHRFIFGKKFDTLNLNPNSVNEKSFFFYLKPPEGNTFEEDLFIEYKNKKNNKKKYLFYRLKFQIADN